MRLKERSISFIANFLLGIAWASVLIGAVSAFMTNSSSGMIAALFFGVMGMVPGAVAVLLLEHFFTAKAHYYELRKQTQLLKTLIDKSEQER